MKNHRALKILRFSARPRSTSSARRGLQQGLSGRGNPAEGSSAGFGNRESFAPEQGSFCAGTGSILRPNRKNIFPDGARSANAAKDEKRIYRPPKRRSVCPKQALIKAPIVAKANWDCSNPTLVMAGMPKERAFANVSANGSSLTQSGYVQSGRIF